MNKRIITHLALGNSYDAITLCNRTNVTSIISVIDYHNVSPIGKYCLHCLDMFLFGQTRGLAKANIMKELEYKINHALHMVQTYNDWGWINRLGSYCDLAHKYEVDLIDVIGTDAYELLKEYNINK